jgi:hypothetical protein
MREERAGGERLEEVPTDSVAPETLPPGATILSAPEETPSLGRMLLRK